jgi:hypothetical protein
LTQHSTAARYLTTIIAAAALHSGRTHEFDTRKLPHIENGYLRQARRRAPLCPMNRGGIGARSLNIGLQADRLSWNFAAGDKVMQVEND